MNSRRLTWLLIVINVVLVYLLSVVFFQGNQLEETTFSSSPIKNEVASIPSLLQDENFDFSEVIERPLFNEERKPIELPDHEKQAIIENSDPTKFKLIGTVLLTGVSQALLQKNNLTIERVELGDTVDGWELKSVEVDHIVIVKGEKNIQLDLQRKSSFRPSRDKRRTTKRRLPGKSGR